MGTKDRLMIGGAVRNAMTMDEGAERPLTIALVNNMSGAWAATERQFQQIVAAASVGRDVRFQCFRGTETGPASYQDIEALFDLAPDGIIVTGAEPKSKSLSNEPLFDTVIRLARWAEERRTPVIWSCLAAHAAVLYLDGIDRQPRQEKLSGVFHADVLAADHPLLQGIGAFFPAPHSRWNGLSQSSLEMAGYRILAQAEEAGVDFFEKTSAAPFTFFQSHPEYEAGTLLREFRRDLRRYQLGETPTAPTMPRHYFSVEAEAQITALCDGFARGMDRFDDLTMFLDGEAARMSAIWATTSVALYRNWLSQIAAGRQDDLSWRCPPAMIDMAQIQNMDAVP